MKKLLVAAGLLAVTATAASAQFSPRAWERNEHPYEQRNHRVCQDKAFRLHEFERRASADGRIDRRERAIIESLRRDLANTCGGYRWRG